MTTPPIQDFFANTEEWSEVLEDETSNFCGIKNSCWLVTKGLQMRTGPITSQAQLQRYWSMVDKTLTINPATDMLVLVDGNGVVYTDSFPTNGDTFLVFIDRR